MISTAVTANSGDTPRPTAAAPRIERQAATRHDTGDFALQARGRRFESAMLSEKSSKSELKAVLQSRCTAVSTAVRWFGNE
jgi:hypothetical protein